MKKNLCKFLAVLLSMTLVLSTLTGVVFAATPQPLFTEDFETGTMDNWKWATKSYEVDTWKVETYNGSKALNMNGSSKTGILYADVSGSEKWSDYIVEYDFTPVTAMSWSGMYFRCTPSTDKGYFMQFMSNKLYLYKVESGNKQITSADCALSLGTTYKIRIELKGENIKIYVDDDNIIDVTDSTYSQGRIALRSQGNGLYVDNIKVTPNIVLEDLEVVSSSIADGDRDVSVNPNVTFVLNRALIEGEEAEFTISDITNGIDYTSDDYTVQTNGETVTLTFKNPLEYTAQHNIKLSVDDEELYDASFITEARYVTQTLFTEDFETGTMDNWKWAADSYKVDTWKVEAHNGSQALNMNGGSKTGVLYADVNGSEKWSDYIVEYDFTPVTAMSWSGMYFRCTNSADKGYFMQFMSGKLDLYKVESGNKQITSADCALTLGTTYKIRIELKGENIKIYVDNNKIIDVTDSTYSQGRIALRSQGNGLYVDNIKVTTKIVLEELEVVSSSIADGDRDVSVNPEVTFVLNRALTEAEEAEFAIRDITNGIDYTSDDYTVQTNGETLTLTFNNPLEYTAQHNIKLSVDGEEIYDASFITEEHYETQTLFTEDFETGNIGNWKWAANSYEVDTWKVETYNGSNALNMNGGSKTGILYADVSGSEKWSDYIVEYDFTPVTAMSWSGMYFRCTPSADKGYFMQFMSGKLDLYKVESGNKKITSADCALSLGTTYKIRIELKGENIKIYVDDDKIIDETDSTYSQGRIALRSQGNGLYVDNIKVTKKTLVLQDLKVLTSSIANGDTNVSVDPEIAITFNRELTDEEEAEFVIRDNTNDIDYTSEDYETQMNEKTLTLTFPGLLAYNAQHSIKLYVNEQELYSVSFTTEKMALSITSLAVTKADGSAIGALKGETDVKVTVNVKNTDASENAVVYVAAYANGGVMRGVGYTPATISGSNTPVIVTVSNISFKPEDTNCRLVAYVWSNDGSLTPLALTQSYSNN